MWGPWSLADLVEHVLAYCDGADVGAAAQDGLAAVVRVYDGRRQGLSHGYLTLTIVFQGNHNRNDVF